MLIRIVLLAALALSLAGCAHAPQFPGHQDPIVWRPVNPQYPLPQ